MRGCSKLTTPKANKVNMNVCSRIMRFLFVLSHTDPTETDKETNRQTIEIRKSASDKTNIVQNSYILTFYLSIRCGKKESCSTKRIAQN